ncbi:hypothetical protein [Cryobacterium aureum]|uniref:hypothetical protein n=1 Tax=Cryobacterium aureum TaxID=995037 RepID=UPI00196B3E35|nr:hypothetical protein [Cryobacterium aureum]
MPMFRWPRLGAELSGSEHRLTRLALRIVVGTLVVISAVAPGAAEIASAAGATPAPSDGIGLRLVEIPVNAADDPRAQKYIVDHVAPGTLIHRTIEVSNGSDSSAHISLYPGAASVQDGAFLATEGHTPNELSSWTSITPAEIDLARAGAQTATVTIAVPADAAPGEQYALIWAEARSSADAGVVAVNRVGIRVYLSIGSGAAPAADFTVDSLAAARADNGQPMVIASVHNTGGRALDLSGTLELLAGPGGLSAGPFPVNLNTTVAVGDTEPVTVELATEIPNGPWMATITLGSGLLERTVEASITFPRSGTAAAVPAHEPIVIWPYLTLAGFILVGATVLLLVRRQRRLVYPVVKFA